MPKLSGVRASFDYYIEHMSGMGLSIYTPALAAFAAKLQRRGRPLAAAIMLLPGLTSAAGDHSPKTNDLTELSLEALMEIDVPKVSSASKFVGLWAVVARRTGEAGQKQIGRAHV